MMYRTRKNFPIYIVGFFSLSFLSFYYLYPGHEREEPSRLNHPRGLLQAKCFKFFETLSPPVDMYLIDLDALLALRRNCNAKLELPLKVLVHQKFKTNTFAKENPEFNITYFADGEDFRFLLTKPKRVLLKVDTYPIGGTSIHIPVDFHHFYQVWKRSRYIPCRGLKVQRNETTRRIPLSFSSKLAELRDNIMESRAYPFLMGGTLLGWYRECSFIPHTYDTDFGLMYYDFSEEFDKHLHDMKSIVMYKQMGRRSDSLEYTMFSIKEEVPMDIFIIYPEKDNDDMLYLSGVDEETRLRFKWQYPQIREFCTGVLLGRAFFVPCNPLDVIKADHGDNWKKDFHTDKFNWWESNKNVQENGEFTEEEMKKYFKRYW